MSYRGRRQSSSVRMSLVRLGAMAGVVALVLSGAVGASVGSAVASSGRDLPGEITLPALYGSQLPQVNFFEATSSGFAWALDQPDEDPLATAYYTSYSGGTRVSSGVGNVDDLALSGSTLTGQTVNGGLGSVDINTGARQVAHCTPTAYDAAGDNECLGFSPSGSSAVLANMTDDSTTVFSLPALPPGYTVDPVGFVDSMDAAGAVVLVYATTAAYGNTDGELLYLDFATGHTVVMDNTNTAEADDFAMNDATLVWTMGYHKVFWLDRSDPTAAPSMVSSPAAVVDIAVSGSNLGYTTTNLADPDASGGKYLVHTGALGADLSSFGAAPSVYGAVETGRDGNFLVFDGTTVADYGAYTLATGSDTVGAPAVLFGPAAPLSIEASAGRIVSVLPDGARSPAQQRRMASNNKNTHLVASRSTPLVHHLIDAVAPSTSGAATAYLQRLADGSCELDVLAGTTVVGRYPVPITCDHVTLSGNLALVSYDQHYISDNQPDTPPGSVLIDLNTGVQTTEPDTEALSGDLLAYFTNGDLEIKNLSTGALSETQLDELSGLAGYQPATGTPLSIAGNWVLLSVGINDGNYRLVALDLATGRTVDVPSDVMAGGQDAVLADGVLAWIDADTRSVHLTTLTDSGVTDTIIGTAHDYASGHDYLALTDEFVAWVASDDTTKVLPLSGASTVPPAFLGGTRVTSFTPARTGKAGDFTPHLAVTRPLTAWTLRISRHGHTIRILRGAAPIGAVQPRWNGRTSTGRRAPNGTYTWTLTGVGSTGRLHAKPGTTGPVTAHIHLQWKRTKA
jgi:hypothetical protein